MGRFLFSIIIGLMLLSSVGAALIQLPPLFESEEGWRLEECLSFALQHNSEVKIAEDNLHLAQEALKEVHYTDLPELAFSTRYRSYEDFYDDANRYISTLFLSQRVPFSSRREILEKEKNALIQAARAKLEIVKRKVLLDVKLAFADLAEGEALKNLLEEKNSLAKKYVEASRKLVELGELSELDLLQAKKLAASAYRELLDALSNIESARIRLQTVMGYREPQGIKIRDGAFILPEQLLLDNLVNQALSTRPELAEISARLEATESLLPLSRADLIYGTLSAGYGVRGEDDPVENSGFEAYFTMRVPLFARPLIMSREAQVKASAEGIKDELEHQKSLIRMEVVEAFSSYTLAKSALKSAESLLAVAKKELDMCEQAFESNPKENALSLLSSRINYIDAKINWLKAAADLRRAAAQLENAVCTTLVSLKPTPSRAIWVWGSFNILNSPKKQKELLKFLDEENIDVIFLSISPRLQDLLKNNPQVVTDFLKTLASYGKSVEALFGDPSWCVNEKGRQRALSRIKVVLDYNKSYPPGFDGIHLDVEPHALPTWKASKASLAKNLLHLLEDVKSATSLPLSVDIPYWYEKIPVGETTLADEVMKRADKVAIMDYTTSPTRLVSNAEYELKLADKLGKGVWTGINTDSAGPDGTYFTSSNALNEVLNNVMDEFLSYKSFVGIAFHHYSAYRALLRGGEGENKKN